MRTSSPKLSRRTVFGGVATAGAVAAAASLLPAVRQAAPEPREGQASKRGGGYSLSEHVRRYYQTARS
ncbi:formate dehydrogenase [Tibeticola sp.]|jgi:hypothetical protein|uniref:formate dehydrogenase n=1 Tax=Tibeticola sp. TaxID=2005368 RepID=UPI00258C9D09|nr:formate dehydrogenase [Tibeticola sp.]MCI4441171.1 formate dehydrogenase [Tibeticola sp.]